MDEKEGVWAAEVVESARESVRRAQSPDAALAALAGVLRAQWELSRASLRVLMPGGDRLRIVAVWSERPTSLDVGTVMSTLSTAYPEVVNTGAPVVWNVSADAPLLDQILRAEGVVSWVSIPLRDAPTICGLLSLSSTKDRCFDPTKRPVFAALGDAVSETLVALLKASGSL